jgi:hypothetical protein
MTEFNGEQIYKNAVYTPFRTWQERKGRLRLMGSKCKDCGQLWFPRRGAGVCGKCNSRNIEDYQCSSTGKIIYHCVFAFFFTLTGYGEYGANTRVSVLIELDDGVRIFSEIVDSKPELIQDGMRVEMVLRKHRRETNGNWFYAYKFVLSK